MAVANLKKTPRDRTYPIKALTDINETLYIKWRNYNETENRCYSATKKSGSDKHFIYTLRVWPYGWEHLSLYDTNVTTEATEGHRVHNAARYKFGPGYPNVLRELVFANKKNNCFILKEKLENNKTAIVVRGYVLHIVFYFESSAFRHDILSSRIKTMEAQSMTLALGAVLLLVAATACFAADTVPYEDDPKNFERQHIADMIGLQQKLYIKKRNFNKTSNRCHSAEKQSGSHFDFTYTLRADFNRTMEVLLGYNTSLKISATAPHTAPNAATYKIFPAYPATLRKLMYINPRKTCLILVEDLDNGNKGCQLVQTEETVDAKVPTECSSVYNANCKGEQIVLYEPYCKNLHTVLPPQ
ncbi:hypothetical protein V5799_006009 [Amblyomma americanum]|uniref:Uncharacterized protein n=1 Tax=Amblyomma americanum TaxID=6943 RepID=A0AAQ4DXL8_AMBAM